MAAEETDGKVITTSDAKDGKKKGALASIVGAFWGPTGPANQPEAAAQAEPLPPGTATPEAILKLKQSVGMDVGSPLTSFWTILDTLEAAIPDPKARWKAAMDVASKTQAITQEMVLEHFVSLHTKLVEASETFGTELEVMIAKNVTPSRERQAVLAGLIEAKRNELADLETDAANVKALVDSAENGIRRVAANYQAAHDAVLTEITHDENTFRRMLDIT